MQTLSASPQGPIDNIESVLRAVSADLAHVGVDLPPLSMLDRSTGQLVGCPNLDLPTSALEPPEPHEILVQFGEHWFRVAGGLTWPELTAAVASSPPGRCRRPAGQGLAGTHRARAIRRDSGAVRIGTPCCLGER